MVVASQAKTVTLEGALPGDHVLRSPVRVQVWLEGDGEYVADAIDLNVHAFGPDKDAALANLRAQIVEHLAFLNEMGDDLAPGLTADRERLRALLAPARG